MGAGGPPMGRCAGTPAYLTAATTPADDVSCFFPAGTASLHIWFRAPAGQQPDVPEIGMHGRRHPHVGAYWDGCLFAW